VDIAQQTLPKTNQKRVGLWPAPTSFGKTYWAISLNQKNHSLIARWKNGEPFDPAAAREELHKRYQEKSGRLPKYIDHAQGEPTDRGMGSTV
jgi:hypothetical protein